MLCQQEIAFTKNKNRIGSEIACLIDSIENKHTGIGRFYGQAPDIDGICIIKTNTHKRKEQLLPGQFVKGKVIDYQNYDLIVEPI